MDMLKRFLNVLTIVFVILFTFLILFFVLVLISGDTLSDENPLLMLVVLDVVMFVGVLATNYIVFKKITLWHKQ